MSKRRNPGEIVKRRAGSGFVSSEEPNLIRVPSGKAFEFEWQRMDAGWADNPGGEAKYCMLSCGDPYCREWANVEIVGANGGFLYHVSECEMMDV